MTDTFAQALHRLRARYPELRAPAPAEPAAGVAYLLHFHRPYRHARHYTGWTTDLPARLAEHAAGHGARLLAVVAEAGIGWTLARTWPGATRADERALKRQGGASRRCPLCGITPASSAARRATTAPTRRPPRRKAP